MNRKFKLDLFGALLAVLVPGLIVWFKNDRLGIAAEHRGLAIAALCIVFVVLLLAFSFGDASRPAAAWRAIRHWVRTHGSALHFAAPSGEPEVAQCRADALKQELLFRHGWRWRYRDRWVLVVGDETSVKHLVPDLAVTGYAVTGDTVLLYAKRKGDQLDVAWLDQIRRLRRRRPVDAIVAVVQAQTTGKQPFDTSGTAQGLIRHARALRWAAPAYVLNVTDFSSGPPRSVEEIGITWSDARVNVDDIDGPLRNLADELADAGVVRLTKDPADRYPAELSQHLSQYAGALSGLVTTIGRSRVWRSAVHGVLFAPLLRERIAVAADISTEEGETVTPSHRDASHADSLQDIWQTIATHSRRIHGRRVGFSLSSAAGCCVAAVAGIGIAGTMLSGFANRATIRTAADTVAQLRTGGDRTQAAVTLDALQRELDTLEVRQRDGAPWHRRFGLNRDAALFAALWPSYANASARTVIAPIRAKLEGRLQQLASLSDAEIASGGDAQVQAAYATLKSYLMLAQPEHADATFLVPQLLATAEPARPANSRLTYGQWEDLRQRLVGFSASHLRQHAGANDGTSLAIRPNASLVSATQQTLVGVKGLRNSTDVIYQQILADAKPKYPPVSLAALLGAASSRGLFGTTATLPGVFTREAWEGRIAKAIDEADEQRGVAGDWVLSNAPWPKATSSGAKEGLSEEARTGPQAASTLKAALRERYFDDYARAWQQFLNGIRWQPDATLSGTIDQLTLLADPQRSPLAALMNVVVYQAGAGAPAESLPHALVSKAQQLVGGGEKNPPKIPWLQNIAPLAPAFGPLLRLAGSDLAAAGSSDQASRSAQTAASGDLSLSRFLERATAMRLKLQQIMMGADPDAMSRAAAQAVLQGKTSDIADSREYASRVAASLGQQWAGFGELFQQPLDQTWQVVLQPAAASLNDTWRTAIVADWNTSLGARYPFADSENDASLPEMARYMRPDHGVIAQFVTTQMAGIIERQGNRWVLAQSAERSSLTVDPAFLDALNKLTSVATVLFPAGDPHLRYELRAVPTPGVTDVKFALAGRELHYFNQKEEWTPFVWPGDALQNVSHVEWQTEHGGVRSALDVQGRFGLVRLLERAKVVQQDSARYLLTWTPDQSQGIPLRVQLRSEAGAGPLDALALRHFMLPERVFVTGSAPGAPKRASPNPPQRLPFARGPSLEPSPRLPPLPPAAIEAAKHAAVPLPQGVLPEVE